MTYGIFTTSLAAIFTLGLSQGAVAASQGKDSLTIDHAAIFAQLDTDGNGLLTQAELAKAAQLRFKNADSDKDGFLSQTEVGNQMIHSIQRRIARKSKKIIERRDIDKDGKISLEEMQAASGKRGSKMFARLDKNEDGAVSAEEFEKMRRQGGKFHRGGFFN